MIEGMAVVHMSEADVVKDIIGVLAKVRQGSEIVIERGNRAVAVIKPSKPVGRIISEVIEDLRARASDATMDDDFARDIEEGIKAHRQPWIRPPGISPRLKHPYRDRTAEDDTGRSYLVRTEGGRRGSYCSLFYNGCRSGSWHLSG